MTELIKRSQNSLQTTQDLNPLSKAEIYTNTVREIIIHYYRETLRPPLSEDDLTATVASWVARLNSNYIPTERLFDVYERAVLEYDYLTAPNMVKTWMVMQQENVHSNRITIQECQICHGEGVALNMNIDTLEDEEVTCICKIGEK